ncbi:alpha/beta hydrolase [Pedobacter aquatilis]|uniref:alpha/beta fold hydrolase n=1 Tax=Pedobacter aquatilis TaxID=351343 RepID=UPI0025B55905|nr:alpha/beta hydrolase [Pedobacter aquatilis]MDN3588945.1 alpha/beta hydrolase [Pedobacter aquatilis]
MITQQHFDHELAHLNYYKFGSGTKVMLCFHGYGMHGKQFKMLEENLGSEYTFYGLDLFFHKETRLKSNDLASIKKGISKAMLAKFISDFCKNQQIDKFSVIGYSMGTHYAVALTEILYNRIDNFIIIAPAALKPGKLVEFFSKNKIGNKILEKLILSEKALINLLKLSKRFNFVDDVGYNILLKEINTPDLRLSLYASFTYLRFLDTDKNQLLQVLKSYPINAIFISGSRDKMYPPAIAQIFCKDLPNAQLIVLNENHEMLNQSFVEELTKRLL